MNFVKKLIGRVLVVVVLFGCLVGTTACGNGKYELNKEGLPVLCYHSVCETEIKNTQEKNNQWVSDLADFKDNMKYLYENGFKTLSMDEFYSWYIGEVEYDLNKTVLITFDDGFYDIYTNVLPVLKEYNLKATVFVVGDEITEKQIDENGVTREFLSIETMNKIKEEYPNLEMQSHTYGMHHKKFYKRYEIEKQSVEEMAEDFAKMESYGFEYFAYPYGIKSKNAVKAFEKSNFKLGFAFGQQGSSYRRAQRTDDPYFVARIKVNAERSKQENFEEIFA